MIDCSIIIVSWNVSALLRKCLDSILASEVALNTPSGNRPTIEIIVVDSNSADDTCVMLAKAYPEIRLFPQSENIGYTRANNIGLEHAQGRYILLLNPDTEVIGDAIPQMIEFLDQHPDVGILGPHTLNSDGTYQSTRRRFPTLTLGFFESTWLQNYAPKSLFNSYYIIDKPDDGVYDVDWVQGSALMARRAVYEQIGGLDTGYTMFSEELDWCRRAKDAGWRVFYLGAAQILHHGGKSAEQANAYRHICFQTGKLRYFRKYHGYFAATSLRLFLLLSYGWQIILESLKALPGHKRALRRERVRIYREVLRSGLKVNR